MLELLSIVLTVFNIALTTWCIVVAFWWFVEAKSLASAIFVPPIILITPLASSLVSMWFYYSLT